MTVRSNFGAGKNWSIFHPGTYEWKGMGIDRFCYPPMPPIYSWFAAAILLMYISIGKFIETPFFVQIHNQTGGDKRVKNDNTVTTQLETRR